MSAPTNGPMLDARTLEAMRIVAARARVDDAAGFAAVTDIRIFLKAIDSARDAERDDALAEAMHHAWFVAIGDSGRKFPMEPSVIRTGWLAQARAARDFIAKEQGQ